jgi:hypothetical protein
MTFVLDKFFSLLKFHAYLKFCLFWEMFSLLFLKGNLNFNDLSLFIFHSWWPPLMASWDSYVEQMLEGGACSKALICGHDGTVWGASAGFQVRPPHASCQPSAQVQTSELAALVKAFDSPHEAQSHGLKINEESYLIIRSTSQTICAKRVRTWGGNDGEN